MLAFVPTVFDLYRPLKPHLRWTMQCLVSFADRAGRCFPSIRKLAEQAGISKSAAARHLAALASYGVITRKRRPGSVYVYEIDARFLPGAPVSHPCGTTVPRLAGQETELLKQERALARFAKQGVSYSEILDDAAKWEARLRSWQRSRFWLPFWGPKPSEPGCWAPPVLAQVRPV
jgi:DNA-binding transcriptional regulator YhcF (GntR family)